VKITPIDINSHRFAKSMRGFDPVTSLRDSYHTWKLARAKKKFQVYMRKKGSDRDRQIH